MNPDQRDNQLAPGMGPLPQPGPILPEDGQQPVAIPVSSVYPHAGESVAAPSGTPIPAVNGSPGSSLNLNAPKPDGQRPKKHHFEGWKSIVSTLLLFILAPAIALSITAFAFQSYQVDGQSMQTTLQDKDRLIVNKTPRTWSRVTHHPYLPKRGDIIVFNQSGIFDTGGNQEKQLIKRVIGLPGERVVVKDGQITIYNKEHPNGYNPDRTGDYIITASTTPGNVDTTVPAGSIFVCGDNRTNSEDSRYFGPVKLDHVVGKLLYRVLPINKIQQF